MNSYTLIAKLRQARENVYLSATDQALFYELVAICNEKKWEKVFEVKPSSIYERLNITDKTFVKSRKVLADAKLLSFETNKDKRIGCKFSFSLILSNSILSTETSKELSNGISDEVSTEVSTGNIPSDNCGSNGVSTGNIPSDTSFPPIKELKHKTGDTRALAHVSPPPEKKKVSRKEKGDNTPLVYPFHSERFFEVWSQLLKCPKWKGKLNYSLQLSLNKLTKYPEEFAIYQIEEAIEKNWTGLVFPNTDEKFKEWLKYGKSNQKSGSNSHTERKGSVNDLAELAERILAGPKAS